jgi:pectate lyase
MRYKSMPLSTRMATSTPTPDAATKPSRRPRPWWFDWLLTVPILLLVPVILVPVLAMGIGSPRLSVRGTITPGEEMGVVGEGFPRGKRVDLLWDGRERNWLPTLKTKGDGSFTLSAVLPGSTAVGEHELRAVVRRSANGSASAMASVVASLTVVVAHPNVALDPGETATPGTSATQPGTASAAASASSTASPTASPTASGSAASASSSPSGAASPSQPASSPSQATPLPSATPRPVVTGSIVGYGRGAVGGAGGSQLVVSNLNDSGSGSLRAALEASGRRTVVFRVAGTVNLQTDIKVSDPFLTVAGETAPAPGITVRGGSILVRAPEVILRHVRLRPGDRTENPGDTDALTLNGAKNPVYNVVIDHVTMLWGPDIGGLAVLGDVRDVTVQNSIMGEGLYLSAHPEGTNGQGGHSHAANITQLDAGLPAPRRLTFWRNLFTTSDTRIPRFQGAECVDVVNNVIYNWGLHSAHGNPRSLNLVNNWYRSGPETSSELFWRLQTSSVAPNAFSAAVYEVGNVADGVSGGRGDPGSIYAGSVRCGGLSVAADSASSAYAAVLASAGATAPVRDQVDQRVITNVVNRAGRFFNGTGYPAPNPYWP